MIEAEQPKNRILADRRAAGEEPWLSRLVFAPRGFGPIIR